VEKTMRGLQDKVAIVAGAAPGNIGGATALRLAQEGMNVIAADLDEAAAAAVVDEINSAGGCAASRGFDITEEASYDELVGFTAKQFGTLGRDSDVISVPLDVWQHTIDVTLTGYMYGIRHALPLLIERGGGAIVNTTSSAVWRAKPSTLLIRLPKAGSSDSVGIPPLSVANTAYAATSWHPGSS
jgi:NAD(P)-dependent dehydrogenase (short-subunit alcohol dehydrogenase family)